jgi:hypothetical protein
VHFAAVKSKLLEGDAMKGILTVMDQTQRTDEREGEKRIILSQMFE